MATEIQTPATFRLFLQQELIRRIRVNPRYSLRAFAKTLRLNPATLSHLLAGRRPMTEVAIAKLGLVLGLKPDQIESFYRAESKNHAPRRAKSSLEFTQNSIDQFNVISEWYYDAILELTHLKKFKGEHPWIAKALGLTVSEVNIAVETLVRMGLLVITKNGVWQDQVPAHSNITSEDISSAATRNYQKKILELAAKAIDEVPKSERDQTSLALTLRSADLEDVRELIKEFRHNLALYARRTKKDHDDVYQLSVSFFPLTNKGKIS